MHCIGENNCSLSKHFSLAKQKQTHTKLYEPKAYNWDFTVFTHALQVIINGTLEEVSQENLMGYVEDFLYMELARRRAEKKTTTIDDLATELEKHLSLRNINCQQLQCNNEALEPATPTAKKIAGQKSLSEVQQLLKDSTPVDYRSFQNQQVTTVEVTLTVPAPVTKIVCERLLVKELGRNRTPVTHDELTGELSVDTIDQL